MRKIEKKKGGGVRSKKEINERKIGIMVRIIEPGIHKLRLDRKHTIKK